jgi:hypothetical protein
MKRWFLAAVLLWPLGAGAGLYTGNKLQTFCADTKSGEPKRNLSWYSSCASYLAGLVDAAESIYLNTTATPRSCFPKGVSPEQLRQVWLNHANQYPDKLHLPAAFSALEAFEQAWPCHR